MATPENTTIQLSKPKKRFTIEQYTDNHYMVLDETRNFWINGQLMGVLYNFGDYCRHYNHLRKTAEEAKLDLPSSNDYEILPPDTPLVRIQVEIYESLNRIDVVVLPNEADRVKRAVETEKSKIYIEAINGKSGHTDLKAIKQIWYTPI